MKDVELVDKLFSTPQKLIILIGAWKEEKGDWPSVSEIYNELNRNTHVWYTWQDFFVEKGIIEIKEIKSQKGPVKKVIILTQKGQRLYNIINECLRRSLHIEEST
jgi:DNA-binding PadR family transcriptional regulator